MFKITRISSGISIFFNGGTFAPPVFPCGICPTNYFTPSTNNLGVFPKISFFALGITSLTIYFLFVFSELRLK